MSEPVKGAWGAARIVWGPLRSLREAAADNANAVLPADAQVVEMPTSPDEPPCVYVRGQRVLQWMVMRYGTEIVSVHESVAAARSALERSGCHSDTPDYCICALVVVETRTKEAAGV